MRDLRAAPMSRSREATAVTPSIVAAQPLASTPVDASCANPLASSADSGPRARGYRSGLPRMRRESQCRPARPCCRYFAFIAQDSTGCRDEAVAALIADRRSVPIGAQGPLSGRIRGTSLAGDSDNAAGGRSAVIAAAQMHESASEPVAAAFRRRRSEAGTDLAPADAWSSSKGAWRAAHDARSLLHEFRGRPSRTTAAAVPSPSGWGSARNVS